MAISLSSSTERGLRCPTEREVLRRWPETPRMESWPCEVAIDQHSPSAGARQRRWLESKSCRVMDAIKCVRRLDPMRGLWLGNHCAWPFSSADSRCGIERDGPLRGGTPITVVRVAGGAEVAHQHTHRFGFEKDMCWEFFVARRGCGCLQSSLALLWRS